MSCVTTHVQQALALQAGNKEAWSSRRWHVMRPLPTAAENTCGLWIVY
jgi:hypothetical protein